MTNTELQIKQVYRQLLQLSHDNIHKPYIKKAFVLYLNAFNELSPDQLIRKIQFPYKIIHAVSEIIGLGTTTIVAIILSELLKEKKLEPSDLSNQFPEEIIKISKGIFLAQAIEFTNVKEQPQLYSELLLNIANDLRVILVLLAREWVLIKEPAHFNTHEEYLKELQVAKHIFAHIAHKLGYYNINEEIENLHFQYTQPELYREISEKIESFRDKSEKLIRDFLRPIEKKLRIRGLKFYTKWRIKSVYSIYKKMVSKKVSLDEIYDILAVRIILTGVKTDEYADCWEVYSVVTDLYKPNPERFRDWLTMPKITGYESLHTTVLGPDGYWIEVQIRSKTMDEKAEKGIAAHWLYKQNNKKDSDANWWLKVRKILEKGENIENLIARPVSNKIYCFTPRGDIIKLPPDSTVLDFAYHVHTSVGEHCQSARVNGKLVPLKYKLKSGDRVEIITSKNQSPSSDWIKIARSSRALSKIKRFLIEKQLKDAEYGKELLIRKFKHWKVDYNDEIIGKLVHHFKLKNSLELYSSVFREKIELDEIKEFIDKIAQKSRVKTSFGDQINLIKKLVKKTDKEILLVEKGMEGVSYKLASCCKPVRGDEIGGFITIGKGVTIHQMDCNNFRYLIKKYPYRKVSAKWSTSDTSDYFEVIIRIEGEDKPGMLHNLTDIISQKMGYNIKEVNIYSKNNSFIGQFKLIVHDKNDVQSIVSALEKIPAVYKVKRIS